MSYTKPEHARAMLERYHRLRAKTFQEMGGICAKCGTGEDLQIDHIDPSKKSFDVARLWSLAAATLRRELAKCQLLCRGCHQLKTIGEQSAPTVHGTTTTYYQGCRCDMCKDAFNAYRREWRARTGRSLGLRNYRGRQRRAA